MADGQRKSVLSRPWVILFFLYVACYAGLRIYGELIAQTVDRRVDGLAFKDRIVASDVSVPRWRRQLYRVVFSPLMVAEEEGARLYYTAFNLLPGTV